MTGFCKSKMAFPLPGLMLAVVLSVFIAKAQQSADTASAAVDVDSVAVAPVEAAEQKAADTVSVQNSSESVKSTSLPEEEKKIETTEPSDNRGSYYGGAAYSASRSQRGAPAAGLPGASSGRRKLAEVPVDSQNTAAKTDSAAAKPVSAIADSVKPVTKKPYAKKTVKISKLKKSEKVLIFTTATTAVVGGVVAAILVNSFKKGEDDKGIPDPPSPPGF